MNQSKPLFLTVIQSVIFSTIILAGCMTVQAQTEMEKPESPVETQPGSQMEPNPVPPVPAQTTPTNANAGKICLTEGNLPASAPFVIVGSIDKSKVTYGSKDSLYPDMAKQAREMGANAVIQVDDFLAPSWFGWATPHLKGKAIKLDDLSLLDNLKCQWF